MVFEELSFPGAFLIRPECKHDLRGYFARVFCTDEFARHGLEYKIAQCSVSFSRNEGTLRGMHFQMEPFEEVKVVRCTRGSIFDVIIDLRLGSPTYKKHVGMDLSERNGHMLYIPQGFAHGFLTTEPDTEVFYQMSAPYSPGHARGVRWNDSAFAIAWPGEVKVILERDNSYPDYDEHGLTP